MLAFMISAENRFTSLTFHKMLSKYKAPFQRALLRFLNQNTRPHLGCIEIQICNKHTQLRGCSFYSIINNTPPLTVAETGNPRMTLILVKLQLARCDFSRAFNDNLLLKDMDNAMCMWICWCLQDWLHSHKVRVSHFCITSRVVVPCSVAQSCQD